MNTTRLFTIRVIEHKEENQFDNYVVLAESFDDAWVRFWKFVDTLDEDDRKYIGCNTDYFLHNTSEHNVCYLSKYVKSEKRITISHTNFDDNNVSYIGGGYI